MEAQLIQLAQRGDLAAYDVLVRQFQSIAFRTAYLITGSPEDAEDVSQEAFLKAFHNLGSFTPGAPFRPWLLKIVTNEALNRRRSTRVRERRSVSLSSSSEPSPEEAVVSTELRRRLSTALAELSDVDRTLLQYRYFLELTVAEIAVILACPESTVRTRLSRALSRLRGHLQSYQPSGKEAEDDYV